jgi:hypothetical protein
VQQVVVEEEGMAEVMLVVVVVMLEVMLEVLEVLEVLLEVMRVVQPYPHTSPNDIQHLSPLDPAASMPACTQK